MIKAPELQQHLITWFYNNNMHTSASPGIWK